MAYRDPLIQHLLRRAGFGATPSELEYYQKLGFSRTIDELINFSSIPDDVDSKIGVPGYVATTSNGAFSPSTVINDARQIMELFTMGVGFYTESDVYAGAKVFSGWNLARVGSTDDPNGYYRFNYVANNHETAAKEFSFPIYPDGSKVIPSRTAGAGMQDGLDLIDALANHPE